MNIKGIVCLLSFLISFSQIVRNCDGKDLPSVITYDTHSKDVIHNCRQKCISEIIGEKQWRSQLMAYFRCRGTPNCFMCWDYCRAVKVAQADLAKSMCNDGQYCFKGCKIACSFHQAIAINDVIENMT